MMSVSRLYIFIYKIINEYGACGITIGRRNKVLEEKLSQCHFSTTKLILPFLQSINLIMISEITYFEAPRYVIVSKRLLVPLS
jgi:hypothetical protein